MTTEVRFTVRQSESLVFEAIRVNRNWYLIFKRLFDIIISILILPFLLVLMAAIAIAIRIDSPGSPIFVQERIGKDGRRFRMYKFRTMRHDHDPRLDRDFMQAFVVGQNVINDQNHNGAYFKPTKDENVTRLGRVLRKTSLDETPQIFNIIKGEMSLIGPRPNLPWEVEKYQDWHYERLAVLPGITGLAQVQGRSCISFDHIVRFDIEYIQTLSLKNDLRILWKTVATVLDGTGAG